MKGPMNEKGGHGDMPARSRNASENYSRKASISAWSNE